MASNMSKWECVCVWEREEERKRGSEIQLKVELIYKHKESVND